MKEITLTYYAQKTVTFDLTKVPKEWQKFFNIYERNEDTYSNKDWDIIDSHNVNEFVKVMTGDDIGDTEVEIDDYK